MSFRTVLLGEGVAAGLGMLLTFGLGLALVVSGATGLAELFRREPQPVACAELDQAAEGRWLTVSDCRFDLARATEHEGSWLAPLGPGDGGGSALGQLRDSELAALEADGGSPPRAAAASGLAGHLERRDDALVLVAGRPPPDGRSLLAFLVGTALLVAAFVPLGRRWLLAREG